MSRSENLSVAPMEFLHRRPRVVILTALAILLIMPRVLTAQADFAAAITPQPVTLTAGGTSATVTVITTILRAFAEPITYSFSGLPAGISTGSSQTVVPPYSPVTFSFNAAGNVAAGTYNGLLTGTTAVGTRTFPVTVVVAPPPSFTLSASPLTLSLQPGQSGAVDIAVAGTGGFSGSVQVNATSPASVSVQPSSFALAPGAVRRVIVAASESAAPGAASVSFTGTAPGTPGPGTVAVTIFVQPVQPVIQSVSPPSVVTGTTENVLRITGRNFNQNAVITSQSAGVQVTQSRIVSATAAEIVVSVRHDAAPGPIRLDLQNPDGGLAAGGARLVVYPARSLNAPLSVTAATIVTPRQWEIVEAGDRVYARALLAISGMGTVIGTWVLDGVPFDQFTRMVSSGFPVEVKSAIPIPPSFTGEHRLELVINSPQSLPARRVTFIQALERRSRIRILAPDADAFVSPAEAVLRWTLVPGASGYDVEIENVEDGSDQIPRVPLRRRLTDTEWQPETLLEELGPGEKRFRVRAVFPGEVFGDVTPWQTFTTGSLDGSIRSPDDTCRRGSSIRLGSIGAMPNLLAMRTPYHSSAVPAWHSAFQIGSQDIAVASSGQFDLTLNSTTTTFTSDVADPPTTTRIQLSNQMDFRAGMLAAQATTDLSGSHDLGAPWHGEAENRNWLASLDAAEGRFSQEARIGFAPPSFFDQAEFLSVFTSGGGIQGSLGSPVGRVSYYRSARLGADASLAGAEPTIEAAAYELSSGSGRFLFRTMMLRATEPEVDDFDAGGKGTALGFIGVVDLGARLRLLGEVASGDFKPGVDSFEEERDGQALRLSAGGTAGTFGYSLVVGWTGEGFVNPANPGFTPGGVSGRTRAELGVQKKLFGKASWSGAYSRVRGGIAEATGDPETTENAARMSFSMPITPRVSFTLAGNIAGQRGDAAEDFDLPPTDRTQKGAELSVSEMLGKFTLSQGVTWQDLRDATYNLNDQRVIGVNLAASGALTSFLNFSANVSDTRSRAVAELGTTNRLLVSLQPSLSVGKLPLHLIPRAAFTWTENDVQESDFRTAMYQIVARWQPSWAGSLIALEVASDWNRSWSALLPAPPPFERRTLFTLSLNWRADHSWGASTR